MNPEVDAIVSNVSAQLDSSDKQAESKAYQRLSEEINTVARTQGEQAATDLTSAVVNRLEEQGKLPQISIGWVKSNYDQINIHKNDGGVSIGEIARYTSESGTAQAALQSVMADRMLRQNVEGSSIFDDIANRSPNSISGELIERADLRAHGRQERREARREARHDQVMSDSAKLLEGSPPLMAVLDASADGKVDGRVSERDMRRFLVAYEVNQQTENAGQYPYTQDNAQFVSDLLEGKYPHITGSNHTGFSAEALCRRAGLDHFIVRQPEDYDTLVQKFADARKPAAETVSSESVAGEGAQPDDQSEAAACEAEIEKHANELTHEQIREMSTFRRGEGHWHVAQRLLNAGFAPEDKASNSEVMLLTKALLAVDEHTLDNRGRPNPMVHPGDQVADFSPHLPIIAQRVPRLAQSIENLFLANKERAAAEFEPAKE